MAHINFDEQKYHALKLLYEKAVEERREQLTFEGHILLTSYVKYLLEHLRTQLNINEKS